MNNAPIAGPGSTGPGDHHRVPATPTTAAPAAIAGATVFADPAAVKQGQAEHHGFHGGR